MAVEEPVTGPFGNPCDGDGLAWREPFRDGELRSRVARIDVVRALIAATVHAEEETVQVHRVHLAICIDDAPEHGVAHAVVQAFGVRPALAIDHKADWLPRSISEWHEDGIAPYADDEDAISLCFRCSVRVDDQGTGQLRFAAAPREGGRVRGRRPVVVRAR